VSPYRYVLEEATFEAFVQLPEVEADLLCSYFRWLSSHPHDEGDGWHKDTVDRIHFASLCGPFVVVHWTDHAVKEVRIVQILRD